MFPVDSCGSWWLNELGPWGKRVLLSISRFSWRGLDTTESRSSLNTSTHEDDVYNTAALLGNQTYRPYGSQQYQSSSMGTNKGFTGQYNDNATGLDYYNARYYDPVGEMLLQ